MLPIPVRSEGEVEVDGTQKVNFALCSIMKGVDSSEVSSSEVPFLAESASVVAEAVCAI
jgi:hypothetical protein